MPCSGPALRLGTLISPGRQILSGMVDMTALSSFWNWTVVSMRFNHINSLPIPTMQIILGLARQIGLGKILYLAKQGII
jgi:hypothetical protein